MDNAVCGDDSNKVGLTDAALNMTKAVILMGDPRHIAGLPYNVGSCTASGVSLPFSLLNRADCGEMKRGDRVGLMRRIVCSTTSWI